MTNSHTLTQKACRICHIYKPIRLCPHFSGSSSCSSSSSDPSSPSSSEDNLSAPAEMCRTSRMRFMSSTRSSLSLASPSSALRVFMTNCHEALLLAAITFLAAIFSATHPNVSKTSWQIDSHLVVVRWTRMCSDAVSQGHPTNPTWLT